MKELYNKDLIYAITDLVYRTNTKTGDCELVCKSSLENWDCLMEDGAKDGDHINRRTYKKNVPFYASLTCTGVGRGTSACRFHWEDEISSYTMFPTDVRELLLMNVATNPLTGYFAVVKKGANFGIKYLGKVNPNGEN